jgi:hypothetical protein
MVVLIVSVVPVRVAMLRLVMVVMVFWGVKVAEVTHRWAVLIGNKRHSCYLHRCEGLNAWVDCLNGGVGVQRR